MQTNIQQVINNKAERNKATFVITPNKCFYNYKGETLSWMEFGKAKDWLFSENGIVHNVMPNNPNYCHIVFTIHKKETYSAKCLENGEHYTFRAESLEDAKHWCINHLDTSNKWQVTAISETENIPA